MQATGRGHDRLAGLKMQVIGVGQHHLSPSSGQLLRADPLHGGQGAHRHEPWGLNWSMGCVKTAAAGGGVRALGADFKAEQGREPPCPDPTVRQGPF